jgi:ankyrin repeat protein
MATAEPISKVSLSSSSAIERLYKACDGGRGDELERVLEEGVTQEDRTALANYKSKETGFTPLHRVCHHGHHQCIPPLLKQNADPHIWDHCGFAPIHCAARGNNTACVELLINSRGCDVNEKTQFGETPFLIACLSGSLEVARYLYESGGYGEEDRRGNTVLHYAAASDSAQLLLWLLSIHDFKALIDSPNNVGHCLALF